MVTQMQLKSSFFGNRTAFVPRSTPVRPTARLAARAEKAATAGKWLPGVDSPPWLEEADLPANRGRIFRFVNESMGSEDTENVSTVKNTPDLSKIHLVDSSSQPICRVLTEC